MRVPVNDDSDWPDLQQMHMIQLTCRVSSQDAIDDVSVAHGALCSLFPTQILGFSAENLLGKIVLQLACDFTSFGLQTLRTNNRRRSTICQLVGVTY